MKTNLFIIILISILVIGCKKEDVEQKKTYKFVATGTTAFLNININNGGVTKYPVNGTFVHETALVGANKIWSELYCGNGSIRLSLFVDGVLIKELSDSGWDSSVIIEGSY